MISPLFRWPHAAPADAAICLRRDALLPAGLGAAKVPPMTQNLALSAAASLGQRFWYRWYNPAA